MVPYIRSLVFDYLVTECELVIKNDFTLLKDFTF